MAKVKLENVRIAFPELHEPKPFQGQGAPRYTVVSLFAPDHPAKDLMSAAIREVAQAKWPNNWENMLAEFKAQKKLCLGRGDGKMTKDGEPQQGYEGMLYVSASATPPRNPPPLILGVDGRTVLTAESGKPYGGCYCNVLIDVWAQQNNYGKRINATLKGVQFKRDGDAFGSGAPASYDDFDDESDGESLSQEDSETADDLV